MKEKLDRLYRQESPKLLAFIRRRISDPEDAEDILQDVFARAASVPNVLDEIENLLGWLYTAAKNKIIDRYRAKARTREKRVEAADENIEDLIADSGLAVEDEFVRTLVEEALEAALEELPEEQRLVFLAQTLEGVTFRELSERSGISINTLMARKRYAVLHLKKRLSALKKLVDDGGIS